MPPKSTCRKFRPIFLTISSVLSSLACFALAITAYILIKTKGLDLMETWIRVVLLVIAIICFVSFIFTVVVAWRPSRTLLIIVGVLYAIYTVLFLLAGMFTLGFENELIDGIGNIWSTTFEGGYQELEKNYKCCGYFNDTERCGTNAISCYSVVKQWFIKGKYIGILFYVVTAMVFASSLICFISSKSMKKRKVEAVDNAEPITSDQEKALKNQPDNPKNEKLNVDANTPKTIKQEKAEPEKQMNLFDDLSDESLPPIPDDQTFTPEEPKCETPLQKPSTAGPPEFQNEFSDQGIQDYQQPAPIQRVQTYQPQSQHYYKQRHAHQQHHRNHHYYRRHSRSHHRHHYSPSYSYSDYSYSPYSDYSYSYGRRRSHYRHNRHNRHYEYSDYSY